MCLYKDIEGAQRHSFVLSKCLFTFNVCNWGQIIISLYRGKYFLEVPLSEVYFDLSLVYFNFLSLSAQVLEVSL